MSTEITQRSDETTKENCEKISPPQSPQPDFIPPAVDPRLPAPGANPPETVLRQIFDPDPEAQLQHRGNKPSVEPTLVQKTYADRRLCSVIVKSYPDDVEIKPLADFFASIAVLRCLPERRLNADIVLVFQQPSDVLFVLAWFKDLKNVRIHGFLVQVEACT